jgi:hypothetical protein
MRQNRNTTPSQAFDQFLQNLFPPIHSDTRMRLLLHPKLPILTQPPRNLLPLHNRHTRIQLPIPQLHRHPNIFNPKPKIHTDQPPILHKAIHSLLEHLPRRIIEDPELLAIPIDLCVFRVGCRFLESPLDELQPFLVAQVQLCSRVAAEPESAKIREVAESDCEAEPVPPVHPFLAEIGGTKPAHDSDRFESVWG